MIHDVKGHGQYAKIDYDWNKDDEQVEFDVTETYHKEKQDEITEDKPNLTIQNSENNGKNPLKENLL